MADGLGSDDARVGSNSIGRQNFGSRGGAVALEQRAHFDTLLKGNQDDQPCKHETEARPHCSL